MSVAEEYEAAATQSAEESAGIASEKAVEAYHSASAAERSAGTAKASEETAVKSAAAAARAAESAAQSRDAIAAEAAFVHGSAEAIAEMIETATGAAESAAQSAEQAGETPHLLSVFAQNFGAMEGAIQEAKDIADDAADTVEAAVVAVAGLRHEFEQAEICLINTPNLLKQNYFEKCVEPTSDEVQATYTLAAEASTGWNQPITFTVTDEDITADCGIYWVDLGDGDDYDAIDWNVSHYSISASAGSATITIPPRLKAHSGAVELVFSICESELQTTIYGQTSRRYMTGAPFVKNVLRQGQAAGGGDPDTVTVQVVEFPDDEYIVDQDNEVYRHALAFTVSQPNTAWGNAEELIFTNGNHGAGTVPVNETGNITEMTVGETYTMSCWARVTNGTKMLIKLGYDQGVRSTSSTERCEWVEVEGSTWRRYWWTFTFNQTGDQFTDTTADNVTTRKYNWTKTVAFGVSRKYAGTVQMCGFRLTAGKLRKNTGYDELREALDALTDRVEALEAIVLENIGD